MADWVFQPVLPASAQIQSTPVGTTGQIKVWTGTAWVSKPVKRWNGSAWEIKPVKYYNGSTWVTTPY